MTDEYNDNIIEVELGSSGLVAWIDEIDRDLLINNWSAKSAGSPDFPHYYAYRSWQVGNTRGDYYLHNEVWEKMSGHPVPKGFLVDHINGDKLDNRRENLRLATKADNEANKRKRRTQGGSGSPTSRYKGVTRIKDGRKKRWRATITYQKKQIKLGTYYTEREAAEAYNEAAKEYYKEFALLNTFEDEE